MAIVKPVKIPEQSTVEVVVTFKDPTTDAYVDPVTAFWTLSDIDGNVINNRENVEITSPAGSNSIWLSGDDFAITDDTLKTELRLLAVYGTYDRGPENVPIRQEFLFEVENNVVIAEDPTVDPDPLIITDPVITNTLGTLTLTSPGVWKGTAPIACTYQWVSASTDIPGETSDTYVVAEPYFGTSIHCDVTATNTAAAVTVASNSITVVAPE